MSPGRGTRRLRARQVLGLVLLGAVLVAALEIAVAVLVARVVGPWPTIIAIVAFSFVGLSVVRRGGAQALLALRDAAAARRLPGPEAGDSVVLLIGGFLMIPPGFVLDLLGLFFVLPFARPLARRLLGAALRTHVLLRVSRAWPGVSSQVVPGEVVRGAERPEPPPAAPGPPPGLGPPPTTG